MKKVSVVVCSYNAAAELDECLSSLDEQDYPEKEIIVVNDGSTDNTEEVLDRFKKTSKTRTVVVRNEKNLGVAGSRNAGIEHSIGDIIAFTDADCTADVRWLSEMVNIFNTKAPAAVGGKILDARIVDIWTLSNKGHDFVAVTEGYVPFIKGCNMSFDSNVLKQFMFNSEIKYGYEELLLCDRLNEEGHEIYYTPHAVVHHKHRSTFSSLMRQKYIRGMSSIWYLKQRNMFFMYKRHFLLFIAFMSIFLSPVSYLFLFLSMGLFSVVALSLLREEILFNEKTPKEMVITFPFLILIEFVHFAGACVGVGKFRIRNQSI